MIEPQNTQTDIRQLVFELDNGQLDANNGGLRTAVSPDLIVAIMDADTTGFAEGKLRGNLNVVDGFIKRSPGVASFVGYSLGPNQDGSGVELRAPNVDGLNVKKQVLSEVADVNTGRFVPFNRTSLTK